MYRVFGAFDRVLFITCMRMSALSCRGSSWAARGWSRPWRAVTTEPKCQVRTMARERPTIGRMTWLGSARSRGWSDWTPCLGETGIHLRSSWSRIPSGRLPSPPSRCPQSSKPASPFGIGRRWWKQSFRRCLRPAENQKRVIILIKTGARIR